MHLSIAQCSERGSRETNQDFIGFCANEQVGCFVLADGAGGHAGGEKASRAVVGAVLKAFQAAPAARCMEAIWLISAARKALTVARKQHPACPQMDTTVAALLINTEAAHATWCQLGDSRIYLFRRGRARQLTHDHSVLQSMIDAGFVQGGLRGHSHRGRLYAAVGTPDTPPTSVCDAPLAIRQGDAFLLCSDGFWDALPEALMEEALLQAHTPEAWIKTMQQHIQRLTKGAIDGDNFSALAVWIGQRIETTRILDVSEQHRKNAAWQI